MECQDLAHRLGALQISTARVLLTSSFCHFLDRSESRFGIIVKRWHALNAALWISGSECSYLGSWRSCIDGLNRRQG